MKGRVATSGLKIIQENLICYLFQFLHKQCKKNIGTISFGLLHLDARNIDIFCTPRTKLYFVPGFNATVYTAFFVLFYSRYTCFKYSCTVGMCGDIPIYHIFDIVLL